MSVFVDPFQYQSEMNNQIKMALSKICEYDNGIVSFSVALIDFIQTIGLQNIETHRKILCKLFDVRNCLSFQNLPRITIMNVEWTFSKTRPGVSFAKPIKSKKEAKQ